MCIRDRVKTGELPANRIQDRTNPITVYVSFTFSMRFNLQTTKGIPIAKKYPRAKPSINLIALHED